MSDEADFLGKLAPIFREELERDDFEISMSTRQSDLENWDSLGHVRIVVAVERIFDVQFDVAEIESMHSVRAFYEAVRRHAK